MTIRHLRSLFFIRRLDWWRSCRRSGLLRPSTAWDSSGSRVSLAITSRTASSANALGWERFNWRKTAAGWRSGWSGGNNGFRLELFALTRPFEIVIPMYSSGFHVEEQLGVWVLRLRSEDVTNRLTRKGVQSLTRGLSELASGGRALVVAGNDRFFSAGADLQEISQLNGPDALEFAKMGQALMEVIDHFPAPVYAAISGYCMGGGLDLALACHRRIASPNAVFGHRGAALGLITGWGGTQRLPRLIGKGRALEMFVAAEKVTAAKALRIGLVDAIAADPVAAAVRRIRQ